MRVGWLLSILLVTGIAGSAQAPPANAKDITQLPAAETPAATGAAPSAQVDAPANLLRIYVATLNGSDTSAMAGLITQTLYESKQVVVTNQQANASLILQGNIVREPIPAKPLRRRGRSGVVSPPPSDSGLSEVSPSDLALLNGLGGATDMRDYRYRLDLEVYNPNGDLVWMSGQGRQALPFESADIAVQNTLKPLLAAIAAWTPPPTAKR